MNLDKKIIIAEQFFSLQGEGKTMGVPAMFIRLGGCNLLCKSKSWTCDTIDVWRNGKAFDIDEYVDFLCSEYDLINKLNNRAHLVITGGEPLIQQMQICSLIEKIRILCKSFPYVEIETNGTIVPKPLLVSYVNQFNVSPKLSSSGEFLNRRYNKLALDVFSILNNGIFKFVVDTEEDIEEIKRGFSFVAKNKIYLMPACSSVSELLEKNKRVAQYCIENQYNFSSRLQLEIWDQATGV